MSQEESENSPKDTALDIALTIANFTGALVPPVGAVMALVTPVIEKRRNNWVNELEQDLKALEEQIGEFSLQNAINEPEFITALMRASRIAISNHNSEKRQMLRNAILNSSLSDAPDETEQHIFISWLDELTEWHIKLLKIFDDKHHLNKY
ncbi:MAG: hypothetical protein AAFR81_28890, partial [Chloroflexota bacterium]